MANNYTAIYKRFNGTDWDTFYFATLATQVSETADRKFLTAAEKAYLTNQGTNGGVALLGAGGKFPITVLPDLSDTYLTKADPLFTGDLKGTTSSSVVAGGGFWESHQGISGIKFVQGGLELWSDTQKVLVAGTGTLDFQGIRLENVGTPTNNTDAATKQYVDNLYAAGVKPVTSVKAATTINITLSGEQTIDGVAVVANDRVLVKNQTSASQNGIYTVSATAWTKVANDSKTGALVFVENGNTSNDYSYYCTDGTAGTWIVHSKVDTYKAAGSGGLTKNINNEFSIATGGVTNAMLAGSISDNKLANINVDEYATNIKNNVPGSATLLTHLKNLYGAVKEIRGTTHWNTANENTLNSLKSLVDSKNKTVVGSAAPGTTGYTEGDLYFQGVVVA